MKYVIIDQQTKDTIYKDENPEVIPIKGEEICKDNIYYDITRVIHDHDNDIITIYAKRDGSRT